MNVFDFMFPSIPVPKQFHSWAKGGPFTNCIACSRELLGEEKVQYVVERAFRGDEVIFEYAMCTDCMQGVLKELSQESIVAIREFFNKRVDLSRRRVKLLETEERSVEPWLSHCVLSGQPVLEVVSYQICALCRGDQMLFTEAPYAMSCEMIDDVMDVLSQKTKDRLGEFTDEYLGLPTDAKDIHLVLV